jgi:hypothetical protein
MTNHGLRKDSFVDHGLGSGKERRRRRRRRRLK